MPVRHPHNQKYSAGLFFGYLEETGSY
jgi:hypothetical protein